MHIAGAIFFFLLAGLSGTYGFINLYTVEQTVFGPASVGPGVPALQFVLSLALIVAAIVSARACVSCCKNVMANRGGK